MFFGESSRKLSTMSTKTNGFLFENSCCFESQNWTGYALTVLQGAALCSIVKAHLARLCDSKIKTKIFIFDNQSLQFCHLLTKKQSSFEFLENDFQFSS